MRTLRDVGWEVGETFVDLGDREALEPETKSFDAVFHLAYVIGVLEVVGRLLLLLGLE